MSNIEVKLNYKGVHELLNSDAMHSVVDEFARKVRERVNGNYEIRSGSSPGSKGRAKASIATADYPTMLQEHRSNALLKAIGGKA